MNREYECDTILQIANHACNSHYKKQEYALLANIKAQNDQNSKGKIQHNIIFKIGLLILLIIIYLCFFR